jgi:hypothetical protein
VDGDNDLEIVIVTYIYNGPVCQMKVDIYSANGVLKRSIPITGTLGYGTAPALADLDGDGITEIIVQTEETLNVVRGDGTDYPGWPVCVDYGFWSNNSAPVVGDVDGDNRPDIIIVTQVAGNNSSFLYVYGRNGVVHHRFPKNLPLGSGAVPAIADIDNDGRNEIIVTSDFWDGRPGYFDKVWVYDLGGPKHGAVQWGQFMANAKHTGLYIVPASPIPSPTYSTLHVTAIGNGSVSANGSINCGSQCSGVFETGTPLILTATPDNGYRLYAWGGAGAGQQGNTCTIVMDSDKSVSAEFVLIQHTLTVSRLGNGTGIVTSNPAGIDCGNNCTTICNPGISLTLTATAANGSTFNSWSSGGVVSGNTCVVTMNSDQNITATFQKQSSGGGSSGGGGGGGGCFINMIGNHSEKETVVIRSHNFYNNFMAWGLLLLSGIAAFQWQLIKRSRQ